MQVTTTCNITHMHNIGEYKGKNIHGNKFSLISAQSWVTGLGL